MFTLFFLIIITAACIHCFFPHCLCSLLSCLVLRLLTESLNTHPCKHVHIIIWKQHYTQHGGNNRKNIVLPFVFQLSYIIMYLSERIADATFSLSSLHCSLISVFCLSPAVFHKRSLTKCFLCILTNLKQLIHHSTHQRSVCFPF